MAPEWVGFIGFVVMLALIAIRTPVGLSMIMVSLVGYAYVVNPRAALIKLAADSFHSVNEYSLSVIPMFVLMGLFLYHANLGRDLYTVGHALLGRAPGGLAMATVVAASIFSSVSGSSIATTSTIARVAVPEMLKYQYDEGLATGSAAAGGTLGILIPPSAALVIYGLLTEEPIGKVLIGGIGPGVLTTALLILTVYVLVRFRPHLAPVRVSDTRVPLLAALGRIWPVPFIFGLSIGGIFAGVMTPTEAGAVGAALSLLFSLVARRLTWHGFWKSLTEVARITAMIFVIVIGGKMFGFFLAVTKIPFFLVDWVSNLNISPPVAMMVIFLIYFILGMFTDEIAMLVVMTPIMYPVVIQLGYDGVWFGALTILMQLTGMLTPPVGLVSFIASGITGVPIGTVYRGVTPFWIAISVAVVLCILFPSIITYLPNLMR